MRRLTLGVIVCVFMGAAVSAQAPDAQVMAPIQKFIDSFNKGDAAGASATHAAVLNAVHLADLLAQRPYPPQET